MRVLNIGFGNFVIASRSAPMKRLRDAAQEQGMLVGAMRGSKIRSMIKNRGK